MSFTTPAPQPPLPRPHPRPRFSLPLSSTPNDISHRLSHRRADESFLDAGETSLSVLRGLAAEQGNSGLSGISPRQVGNGMRLELPGEEGVGGAGRRARGRMSLASNVTGTTASPASIRKGKSTGGGGGLFQGLIRSSHLKATPFPATPEPAEAEEEEEEEEDPTWAMINRMRQWRHDAILQHLYETAAFWGDKIFAWTGDPNDAFWLAQTHFLTQHYLRAERILTALLPPSRMPQLHSSKGKGREMGGIPPATEEAEEGEGVLAELADLGGLWGSLRGVEAEMEGREEKAEGKREGEGMRLIDWSVACRYLAAQCMIHQDKFGEALDLLGESNLFSTTGRSGSKVPSGNNDLKLESSICHLRAHLHLRCSSFLLAKEAFMEALALDVRNYDAFRECVEGGMMGGDEEWEFINNLNYKDQLAEDDAEFVKLMYMTRLNKNQHGQQIAQCRQRLADEYNLGDNPDVLVAIAEDLYARYRWEDCYLITSKIIATIPGHPIALPLHLACMSQIPRLSSSLFMLAHELVEQEPDSAITWYAVGLWYFTGGRWAEARRYFSKTNLMDSRFAPAWITFAHSFAYEGEHEQAITAYSTSARLFQGSYLPHVCIGMEYLQLSSYALAEESFLAAKSMCATDPLLLNELGVSCYNKKDYEGAIQNFEAAISGAKLMQGVVGIWASTHCNLGHAYRQLKRMEEAKLSYRRSIQLDALNVCAYSSLGLITHEQENITGAINFYHEALAIAPQDPVTTVLLEIALAAQIELGALAFPGLPPSLMSPDLDPFSDPRGNRLLFPPSPLENPEGPSFAGGVGSGTAESISMEEDEQDISMSMEGSSSMDIE